ncbi:hypothetical protein DN062_17530 [Nitrincola tibetensis]|uniref:Flagellar hook-length control protein-like C-terminal domain-containing protein n=1 Tax=Nitrincola tibetensis TaxID=2219697 RepID=A0A364NHG6_9GAMM|nr:flagellar hook-length control protein FliK [Nitrincola tibetensis]RAU16568.1 hypothetical protein DN062_17530 [Nitrincola tibetensis]
MSFSLFPNLSALGLSGAISMPASPDAKGTQAPSGSFFNTPKAHAFSALIEKASGGRDSVNAPSAVADSSASQGNSLPVVGRELPRNSTHTAEPDMSPARDNRLQTSNPSLGETQSSDRRRSLTDSASEAGSQAKHFAKSTSNEVSQVVIAAEDKSTHVKAAEPSLSDIEASSDVSKVVVSDLTKAIHRAIHQAQDDAQLYKTDTALREAIRDNQWNADLAEPPIANTIQGVADTRSTSGSAGLAVSAPSQIFSDGAVNKSNLLPEDPKTSANSAAVLNVQNENPAAASLISGVAAQVSADKPQVVVRPRQEASISTNDAILRPVEREFLKEAGAHDNSIIRLAEERALLNAEKEGTVSNPSPVNLIGIDTVAQNQSMPLTSETSMDLISSEDALSARATQPEPPSESDMVSSNPELDLSMPPAPQTLKTPSGPIQEEPFLVAGYDPRRFESDTREADTVNVRGETVLSGRKVELERNLFVTSPLADVPDSQRMEIIENARLSAQINASHDLGQLDERVQRQGEGVASVPDRLESVKPSSAAPVRVSEPVSVGTQSPSLPAAPVGLPVEGIIRSEPLDLPTTASIPTELSSLTVATTDLPAEPSVRVEPPNSRTQAPVRGVSLDLPDQASARVESPNFRAEAPIRAESSGVPTETLIRTEASSLSNDNGLSPRQEDVTQLNRVRGDVQPPIRPQADVQQANVEPPLVDEAAIRREGAIASLSQNPGDTSIREASAAVGPRTGSPSIQPVPEEIVLPSRDSLPRSEMIRGFTETTVKDAPVQTTEASVSNPMSAQNEVLIPSDTDLPKVDSTGLVADTPEAAAAPMLFKDKEPVQKTEPRLDKSVRKEDSVVLREAQRPVGAAVEAERIVDSMRLRTEGSERRIEMELRESMLASTSSTSVSAAKSDGSSSALSSALNGAQQTTSANPATSSVMSESLRPAERLMNPAWAKGMGERAIMMVQQGPKVAEIRLDPPELGSLRIRIHVHAGDQVNISFSAPNANVREVLEQHMPRLREMFAEQGLNLADSSVSDQSSQQQKDKEGGGFAKGGKNIEQLNENSTAFAKPIKIGLVDYYA